MRISYNWLKSLLPDLAHSPEAVAELLTMHSFETEVVDRWDIDPKIMVTRIVKIEPHPNADRLQLATVTDGKQEVRVVCGARNIAEGDVVPYAPPGTVVKDQEGGPFTIKETNIRGEKSPGMLNSLRELGLGADHSGIFLLPADTPLGTALADHIPNDVILEADITPNRAHDCLSHLGIAREVAALLDIPVHEPEYGDLPKASRHVEGFSVYTEDPHVSRYMGVVLSNATPAVSPLWMQARLLAMDARPINAIVDATNYVMFELGNPSHAFDAERLEGKTISVRGASEGETIPLLDGTSPKLPEGTLVITSDDKPLALAGIIGGRAHEVADTTTGVFLEIANFQGYAIQETVKRLGKSTQASIRFAKHIDPNGVEIAAKRLVLVLQKVVGAHVEGVMDYYPHRRLPKQIYFSHPRVSRLAGIQIEDATMKQVLKRLRCKVEDASGKEAWHVTVPTDRLDIEGEHDVVEEIIRVVGLDAIASQMPDDMLVPVKMPKHMYWREVVRDRFEPHQAALPGVGAPSESNADRSTVGVRRTTLGARRSRGTCGPQSSTPCDSS
jgi:phenylalanyl-tRNA synthetase beta chain